MAMNFEKLKQQQEDSIKYFPKDYKPIDMLYKQTLYGKLNLDGRPIIPKVSSILSVSTPSSRNSNATALNIMSIAFEEFSKEIEKAVIYNRFNKTNTLYYPLIPKKSYQSVFTLSEEYIIKYINTNFFIDYFKVENRINTTISFSDFINQFINFFNTIRTPLTPSGFHLSTRTVYSSGAVIEIADKKYQNIDEPTKWYKDPNLKFICNTAKKYSLYIDKNFPWRFVFNFDSPVAQKYYERLGYVDKKDYFNNVYSNLYIEDLIYIQIYFSNLFINFQRRYPTIKEYKICNNSTVLNTSDRTIRTLDDTINLLSTTDWVKLYIYLRFKESSVNIQQVNFNSIMAELDNLKNKVDNNYLFDYTERVLSKHIKMGGNPSPSSLNEDFSNIFDYDIIFKL